MIGALCEKVLMSAIAKTVWLLESRLFEPITLDDVANLKGVYAGERVTVLEAAG